LWVGDVGGKVFAEGLASLKIENEVLDLQGDDI